MKKDNIYRYFNKISKKTYNKYHIAMNKELIYNAVFNSKIINKALKGAKITVVDIGSGYCDLEKKLVDVLTPDQDILVIAVDISSNMLENSETISENFPFDIQFIVADATSTGLQDNCSDITFVINVLPYIEDAKILLSELYRITRHNGIITIVNSIKDRFDFWEKYFDEITIYFHEELENIIDLDRFKIVESTLINLTPIQDVEIIKLPIAKLMVLEVRK